MNRYVLKWEIGGVLFVFLLGALLHFLFEWSGENEVVGAFASVNESVWEHLKQGFWPMCLFAALEYRFVRTHVHNFLFAKAVAVFVIPAVTVGVFYAYTAVTGHHILLVDIFIFLVAVVIGQAVSYRLLISAPLPRRTGIIAPVLIFLLGFAIVFFTYYPPHLPAFLDETGFYGLP